MDYGRDLSSSSEEKQNIKKVKTVKNSKSQDNKNVNECASEQESPAKAKSFKPSMIPVMKNDKYEIKNFICKRRPTSSSKPLSASKAVAQKEDLNYKLKLLEEKEKSIAEYYLKIEEIIQKSLAQKRNNGNKKSINRKNCVYSSAKKMTSDPVVFSKGRIKNEISEFENNIQQISQIWLKTTSDLSSTLKNLKNNLSVDPIELQMENIRIQLAIKQAKSLTLIKTRSVIAEAKKLFRNREIIRAELESLLNKKNLKDDLEKNQRTLEEKQKTFNQQNGEEQGIDGTGDSLKETDTDSLENSKETSYDKYSNKESSERMEKEALLNQMTKPLREDSFLEDRESGSDEATKERNKPNEFPYNSAKIISEMEIMKKELSEKNKTITNLNKKIFDLQKTCNENSAKYNQLQVKLFEFHEKIQWNQVLWKQIGKLKERIKGLQQNNKDLEIQKKELECKIISREQEVDRLIKLNHILNQKKHLLDAQEFTRTECRRGEYKHGEIHEESVHEKCFKKVENEVCFDEKIIGEKQVAISQLKKILNVMKEQENFSQKQICMLQSKIEEMEKKGKK